MTQGVRSQLMAWFRCRAKSRVIVVDEMAAGHVFLGILLFSLSVFFHIGS